MPPRRFAACAAALLLAFSALSPALAAFSDWKDTQGTAFRGEPVEVLGPFALFRTPNEGGRRVLLRSLSAEDQIRFATAVTSTEAKRATSPLTAELSGSVSVVKDGKLAPIDLATRPLPEVLVVFYGASNNGESWSFYFNFLPTYQRLRAAYADRIEVLLFGLRTDAASHRDFAVNNGMPWLVTDHRSQPAMTTLAPFAPAEGIRAVALSRSGVPLASSRAGTLSEVRRFIDEVTDLLYLLEADNPLGWPDRLAYFNTVRPGLHASTDTAPLLIGSPLRKDVLRRKGITDVAARIEVGVDGRPTAVTLAPDCGVPEPLRPAIADGLKRGTYFSPAVAKGQPVAGSYDFRQAVPPPPRCSPADLAWVNGEARVELSLPHWLLLRPIPVPESSFSSVDRVDENGVSILTPFEVSDEKIAATQQRNSFDGDWFELDGADTVNPTSGAKQMVEGHDLVWDPVLAQDGFVEMRSALGSCDFSIGYAYTVIDASKDTDAWLAIGSDDGLKIWLNGKLVHSRWIRRNSKLDDEIVPLHLQAGKNRLLLKIQNRTQEWSFVARLRTR